MSFAKLKHDFLIALASVILRFMPAASYMLFAGEGSAGGLCKCIARSGLKRLLVVTDKPLVELGIVERALAGLADAGVETVIYDGVMPDPSFQIVSEGAARYREHNCDSILAIGGGSSIDAAKIIGLAVSHEGDPRDYIGFGKVKDPIPPFYAIPTTSGTGSEATMGAVISDTTSVPSALKVTRDGLNSPVPPIPKSVPAFGSMPRKTCRIFVPCGLNFE